MNKALKTIRITYCSECGLLEDALTLSSFIQGGLGIPVELKEGHNGIFEIKLNDDVIYPEKPDSKLIPDESEIISIITERSKTL